jgi:hypothetical protein
MRNAMSGNEQLRARQTPRHRRVAPDSSEKKGHSSQQNLMQDTLPETPCLLLPLWQNQGNWMLAITARSAAAMLFVCGPVLPLVHDARNDLNARARNPSAS